MKLRVGLVGLGKAWDVRYRPALRSLADKFEVRAVCEQVAMRAEQAANDFNATAVDGFRALTAREDIDAILMLAEQWYGWLPILAAAQAGKAIYCAAPLQLSLDEAKRIKDRVDDAGVAFMAEFPRRQYPATLRLKELIATRLGQPKLLFCHRRIAMGERPHPKLEGPKDQGFGTSDLVELVDWCRYVVGREPTSVMGLMHNVSPDSPDEDYRMMSLDFTAAGQHAGKEVMAQISSGYYMPVNWEEAVSFRPPPALQVACENGIAFVDLPAQVIWFDKAGRHQESLDSERPVGEQLLSSFHRSVTSLVRNPAGLEDAYRALVVVLASRRSHEEGRRIPLAF
jgi:predicted dehydrogenase